MSNHPSNRPNRNHPNRPAAPHNTARAEATGENIPVEFGGVTYMLPPSSKWDLDAMEAAEQGQLVTSTRLILGAEQWAEFRKHNKTLGDLERFMSQVEAVVGGNL